MKAVSVEAKATRFKGGTWSVAIRYPDGSSETCRGLVDHWQAQMIIDNALTRVEAKEARS